MSDYATYTWGYVLNNLGIGESGNGYDSVTVTLPTTRENDRFSLAERAERAEHRIERE